MTLLQIEYFLDVAGNLSISQTARSKYVSQPAVSKQLSTLEEEIGFPLFERAGNRLRLTEEGERMYTCLSRSRQQFESTLSELRQEHEHSLSVGYTASISISPGLLQAHTFFRSKNISLEIESLGSHERNDRPYDILITYESNSDREHMRRLPLFEVRKFIAFSKNDPLAQKPDLCPLDFADRTLFLGSSTRKSYFEQLGLCGRLGLEPRTRQRNNVASILLSVIAENGFCIIDDLCREMSHSGLMFLPLEETERIVLLQNDRVSEEQRMTAEQLADFLRDWYMNREPPFDTAHLVRPIPQSEIEDTE